MTGETTVRPAVRIHGRSAQRKALRALLDGLPTRCGRLLLTGEPGLGRTTLLQWAARSFRAGPVLHLGPAPDPDDATVTAGQLLDTLRAAAGESPLLVCVDDAHLWNDPARTALVLAAEHLSDAGRVGLLLSAAADRAVAPDFDRLPVVRLDPLAPQRAAALLDDMTEGAAAPAVRGQLLAEAEGNPALLAALVRRLSPAELRGHRPLPVPLADAPALAEAAGGVPTGPNAHARDLLLTVAAAVRASDGPDVDAGLVRAALRRLRPAPGPGARPEPLPAQLALAGDRLRFHSPLVRRTVYATAAPDPRRAVHRALADALESGGHQLPELLHRSWSLSGPAPAPAQAERLAAVAADGTVPASHLLRATAYARAAELTADGAGRAERYTAAAGQALLAGRPEQARPLLVAARRHSAPAAVRGRAELVRGLVELRDGPVGDAHQSLLLAASLLAADAPADAATAAMAAADAAWAAGDLPACLATLAPASPPGATALDHGPPGPYEREESLERQGRTAPHPVAAVSDHRAGMRALLEGRFDRAGASLGQVVARGRTEHRPEPLLRSAAAALLLGDVDAARGAGARALAAARQLGSEVLEPRALEYLAYAELRAGRHPQARAHAEEGLRAALRSGQRNTAAHHRAVLALAASIEEEPDVVAGHVAAALDTARRHGLAQAVTLAQWAAARADLGRGRAFDAADRLGLLVLPGPGRGHFAVWRLAVPCFVEAAVLAGREEDAREALTDLAGWAAFGADPQAAAQLARCRALLAPPESADELYRRALARHDEAGGDFERARTALLYGKWLRRRRRPREARGRLGTALAGFERCGAGVWAAQARDELRALGATAPVVRAGTPTRLSRLTPQQLRIARHVAEGATNREVALTLAVSTRTVDYHLRKVFAALGVRSRLELARVVGQAEQAGEARRPAGHQEKTGAQP
ncbi:MULTISPECIES: helix-turn-helix transcriptional regulator [Streptomyces]|uniref:helix-turn-helix transcriptional regulator n=1 Tax=Streptomyces TaxID=1883 RepID=UPI0012923A4E|nr:MULTISPECIES: LuxR family transcriptional regulator [Streptomyces]MCX5041102.1 LuxR C-terminal-related transcriptional regulator [Streptomyces coelicoflavus]QFX79852.1 LuxR family transcriptional regulator [Streptomyces sp. SYP-A7193]